MPRGRGHIKQAIEATITRLENEILQQREILRMHEEVEEREGYKPDYREHDLKELKKFFNKKYDDNPDVMWDRYSRAKTDWRRMANENLIKKLNKVEFDNRVREFIRTQNKK